LRGRAGVRGEEALETCVLFSVFVLSQYYREREEKELPRPPGLVYEKARDETP